MPTIRTHVFNVSIRILCLMLLMLCVGCDRGAWITINKAEVSKSGELVFGFKDSETCACTISSWTRDDSGMENCNGSGGCSSSSLWSSGSGESTSCFSTDEPASVQFYVHEGDHFFIPYGTEKAMIRYSIRGETFEGFVGSKIYKTLVVKVEPYHSSNPPRGPNTSP
jgi:hypothetical protein